MLEHVIIFVLLIVLLFIFWEYSKLKGEVEIRAKRIFGEWRERELAREADEKAKLLFQAWKIKEEEKIREDAVKRSADVIIGKVGEQLAPIILFSNYGINPKDVRFIGTPIDFIVFKGLNEGEPKEIVFIEVKGGKTPNLTVRERKIRDLVEQRKISWLLLHMPEEIKR